MCIIEIWTKCACSSAYKFIKNQIFVLGCMLKSHTRNGNEFQTPWNHWLLAKHWDAWFLNSSKSKTRLKFMKLGMLSWSGMNMPWYKFCPIWCKFGYMLLTNRSFSQLAWWFSVGNVPPLGTKRYPLPLIAFKFFFSCQHRTTGVLCQFLCFFMVCLDIFMHLLSFQCIYVHNSNLNDLHMLKCI